MADIFKEIDEDLRRDQLEKLWQRYRGVIIAGAVAIVVAAAAYSFWQQYRKGQDEKYGLQYAEAAALSQSNAGDAATKFETLASDSAPGYAMLARLQGAVLQARGPGKQAGVAALKAMAADRSVDEPYRGLAGILSAQYGLDDAEPAEIVAQLQPLTVGNNPWRFSALELTAMAQIKAGDKTAALGTLKQVSGDSEAPQSTRQRADEIIAALSH